MKDNTLSNCTKSTSKNHQLKTFLKVFNHYYGSFKAFFKVTDPRKSSKCLYPLESYLYLALMMFLLRLQSVRQVNYLLNTVDANKNFGRLFGCPSLPHSTSLNKICRRLIPEEMQVIASNMLRHLIRQRVLETRRLLGKYYMIAVDGTYVYSSPTRHCEHCLTRTSKKTGKTTYYHMILEAKLVTKDGFAFSVMSEFVQNEEKNPSKQDCETKAFHRLAAKLKQAFPKLPIILLLDGLFADGSIFLICRENNWEALIVLKDKDLSTVNQEFKNLKLVHPEKSFQVTKDGCKQDFSWCNDIDYRDGKKRQFSLSIVECIEQQADEKKTKYKSISTIRVHRNNIRKLSDAARTRWIIENQGFNTQKNHGFGLKHQYSKDYTGMKIFYYLLQICHTWEQLTRRSNLFKRLCTKKYGSIKNIYFNMLEAWRREVLSDAEINFIQNTKVQLRLDSG
jgi:hypothetical protein